MKTTVIVFISIALFFKIAAANEIQIFSHIDSHESKIETILKLFEEGKFKSSGNSANLGYNVNPVWFAVPTNTILQKDSDYIRLKYPLMNVHLYAINSKGVVVSEAESGVHKERT